MKTKLGQLGSLAGTRIAAAVLVLVVVPTVLVTLVAREREFSPFDEFAHVDYLRRVERLELPSQGDLRERATLREERCRGVPLLERVSCLPASASYRDLLAVPVAGGGFSYEAQQPPLYYAVTAVFRLATDQLTSDYVESARLTGILWLSGGLLMLYWAIRRLGGGHYATLLGCAVVVGSPAAVWQTSTVNNDAAAIVVGASALLILGWLRRADRLGAWVLSAVAAAACIWLKPTFFVAFIVVAVVLFWWRRRTDPTGVLALRLGVLLAAPTVAYLAWAQVFASRATVSDQEIVNALLGRNLQTDVFPWRDVLPSAAHMLRIYDIAPLHGYSVPIDTPSVSALATIVGFLLLASGVSWLFIARPASPGAQIGIVTVGALVLLGPLYVLLLYLQYGQAGGAHQRYALVLLPFLAAALALSTATRGRAVIGALVAASLVAQVIALA